MSLSRSSCSSPPLGHIQEQRDKWERNRTRITKELVQTEQQYCQQLQLVTTYFMEILKAKGTLKLDVRESVFSSMKHIHRLNQSLLVHLENGYLGRGFDHFCPELHHYRVYVDNFYNAQRVLRAQLKKSKAFRRFKKLQESRAEFRGQSLEELLELPLTRVQRYKLLLETLTANTSPQNPEFHQLSRAVGALSELNERVEENKRHHENLLQLQRVQRLLRGTKTRILSPGRWFLRQGPLQVVPPKGSEAKVQMFFLFSDVLLQTRHSALSLSSEEHYTLRRAFPLQHCHLDKVFGHTRSQGGLLSLSFPKAKLLLMSNDPDDFSSWFDALSSAVRKLQSEPTEIHNSAPQRKRPALSALSPEAVTIQDSGAPKRSRQEPAGPSRSAQEPAGPSRSAQEPAGPSRSAQEPAEHNSAPSSCTIL